MFCHRLIFAIILPEYWQLEPSVNSFLPSASMKRGALWRRPMPQWPLLRPPRLHRTTVKRTATPVRCCTTWTMMTTWTRRPLNWLAPPSGEKQRQTRTRRIPCRGQWRRHRRRELLSNGPRLQRPCLGSHRMTRHYTRLTSRGIWEGAPLALESEYTESSHSVRPISSTPQAWLTNSSTWMSLSHLSVWQPVKQPRCHGGW